MPTESGKPLIVISYAHADEPEHPAEGEVQWATFVLDFLKPAVKHGVVDLWVDLSMRGGAEWEREIEQKLRACDIFLLLVSRHSLASDYVVDKEIPIIRERQAKGEAVQFYPLVLTPTPRAGLDVVRDKNLRPRDGKPLSDYPLNERYRHMNEAANDMGELAGEVPPNPRPPDPVRPRRAWILVAGTGNTDTLPARLDETCRKLGASLANAGYGLVTGGWRGVDEQTGRHFAREWSRIGVPLEDRLI